VVSAGGKWWESKPTVGGEWLAPEARSEQWSRVVDVVGAIKHNNLRCHSLGMARFAKYCRGLVVSAGGKWWESKQSVGIGVEWWVSERSGGHWSRVVRQNRVDPSVFLWIRQTQQSSLLNTALLIASVAGVEW